MSKMEWFGVVMGHTRSLKIETFDRAHTSSYYPFIVTFSLSCTPSEIARYWSKIADLNLPHLYLAPPLG